MDRYRITTLVDITRSQPSRIDTDAKKHGQQSNFNSLFQAINMRTNIANDRAPISDSGRLPNPWTGKARFWVYEFETERSEVFWNNGDPVGSLKDDLDGVPVVDFLDNTTNFPVPIFVTRGEHINTIIEQII
jgi:hypothetical protein